MHDEAEPIKVNRGRHILVVDDDPDVSKAIKMMLEHDGHSVQTAGSAKEALSLFEQGTFDVVITDYSMREVKGDKLAIALKQRRPGQPVVMITAHADVLQVSGNPLNGVDFLLSKPFFLDDLREALFCVLLSSYKSSADEVSILGDMPRMGGGL